MYKWTSGSILTFQVKDSKFHAMYIPWLSDNRWYMCCQTATVYTHPTVTRHLLKKTHPEVEILRWSLFKPLGCLLLKCLSRNAECPQQQWTHQLPCRSAQLPPPSRLKLASLSLASGACLASHSTLASLHAKTAGKIQDSLALAFNLMVAMPQCS